LSGALRRATSGSIGRRKTRHAEPKGREPTDVGSVDPPILASSPQFDRLSVPFRQLQTMHRASAPIFGWRALFDAFTHEFIQC
jgi:hypothetical protein